MVAVAKALGGEIVSADSMQVYRGLPVLTDQPAAEMLAAVPHHLVAAIGLDEEYSAARFAREARVIIRGIAGRGNLPLLVGGTGLYIRALLGGFSFAGRASALRSRLCRSTWQEYIRVEGLDAAYRELMRRDPAAAAVIDRDNPRRLVRALEAAEAAANGCGRSVSAERRRLWTSESPYEVISFGLIAPRTDIYRRIEDRVDRMLASGAIDEVGEARRGTVSATASQAIGFREICEYLDGHITIDQAAAAIKQKSRRYAKRQLTWMRKMPDIVRIDVAGRAPTAAAKAIIDHIHDVSD